MSQRRSISPKRAKPMLLGVTANPRTSKVRLNGAQVMVRVLKACGIRNIYGVVGGALGPLLKSISSDNSLSFIGTRHEAAGAWMATAVFHSTGSIGVCLGEQGPGGLNLLSGLGTAYNNNLAVLAITSNVPSESAYPFEGKLMEADHKRLFEGLTKWNAVVNDVRRLPALLRMAVREATTGCPGPVHLDVPGDMFVDSAVFDRDELDVSSEHFLPARPGMADPAPVAKAIEILSQAARPLVVAGGGVWHAEAQDALLRVIDELGAPATATMTGIGSVPTSHGNFIGNAGVIGGPAVIHALRESDTVLAVGCRFSSYMWDGTDHAIRGWPSQSIVQIDIDPTRIGRARPIAVGLCGDARVVLEQIADGLAGRARSRRSSAWRDELRRQFAGHQAQLAELADAESANMSPPALTREIGRFVGEDGLIVLDGGHTVFWGNGMLPAVRTRTRFNDAAMAHLGYGVPYAHALKHLFPNSLVLNVTGDGSFGFTVQELDTARRYKLAAIHVIHNNQSWGIIKAGQAMNGFSLAADLGGSDYAAIARGFGCYGETVTRPEEVIPALGRAVDSGLPAVVDARVAFIPHPQLPDFGRMGLAASKDRDGEKISHAD